MGITNRGKFLRNEWVFRGVALPTNFYLALVIDDANAPSVLTNTFGELTEIVAGNGYTSGGYQLSKNTTDFDSHVQNDTLHQDELQIKDIPWTASGGNIPASGSPALWAVLTTDEATIANRQVVCYWYLTTGRSVTDTQILKLKDLEMRTLNYTPE